MPSATLRLGRFWLEQRKGSIVWYIAWRDAAGTKQRSSTGERGIAAAERKLAEQFVDEVKRRDERPDQVPLAIVLERYQRQHGSTTASRVTSRIAVEKWKAAFVGAKVREVTVPAQSGFVQQLRARGHSDGYIKRIRAVGKAALNRAYKFGEIVSVPFVELIPDAEPYPHYATRQQLASFLNAIAPEQEHLWLYRMIRLNTGCRGDAAARPEAISTRRRRRPHPAKPGRSPAD